MDNIPKWLLSVIGMALGVAMGYGLLQGKVSENSNRIEKNYDFTSTQIETIQKDIRWIRDTLVGRNLSNSSPAVAQASMQELLRDIREAVRPSINKPKFGPGAKED